MLNSAVLGLDPEQIMTWGWVTSAYTSMSTTNQLSGWRSIYNCVWCGTNPSLLFLNLVNIGLLLRSTCPNRTSVLGVGESFFFLSESFYKASKKALAPDICGGSMIPCATSLSCNGADLSTKVASRYSLLIPIPEDFFRMLVRPAKFCPGYRAFTLRAQSKSPTYCVSLRRV